MNIGTFSLVPALLMSAAASANCTPVPTLLAAWTQSIAAEIAANAGRTPSEQEIRDQIKAHRTSVEALGNPFYRIARMDSAERSAISERVLWEDGELMVLVNKPRGPTLYALVIPKERGTWLPVDANTRVMRRLEETAAVVSDSFIAAAGDGCVPASMAMIEIHPPKSLGVQQLHVHVRGSQSGDQDALYSKAATYLAENLWRTARY